MITKDEALKQAREWIDAQPRGWLTDGLKEIIADINEALAQPAQEPEFTEAHLEALKIIREIVPGAVVAADAELGGKGIKAFFTESQPAQEPDALQGLAPYLRCLAYTHRIAAYRDTLLQWAREVDAVRAPPAQLLQELKQCNHPKIIEQYTGDGRAIDFCPECGKNFVPMIKYYDLVQFAAANAIKVPLAQPAQESKP